MTVPSKQSLRLHSSLFQRVCWLAVFFSGLTAMAIASKNTSFWMEPPNSRVENDRFITVRYGWPVVSMRYDVDSTDRPPYGPRVNYGFGANVSKLKINFSSSIFNLAVAIILIVGVYRSVAWLQSKLQLRVTLRLCIVVLVFAVVFLVPHFYGWILFSTLAPMYVQYYSFNVWIDGIVLMSVFATCIWLSHVVSFSREIHKNDLSGP